MKKSLSMVVAGLIIAACAHGESAHKGWATLAARWSYDPPSNPEVRDIGMAVPGASIDQPDPPTNGTFRAGYLYRIGSTITVQRVYMLVPNEDGTIRTKESKATPPSLFEKEVITGYYSASFSTEKVSFKEGDVFVVVFKIDGQTTPVFLKIIYNRFVPS
jgi:hypothetical protein